MKHWRDAQSSDNQRMYNDMAIWTSLNLMHVFCADMKVKKCDGNKGANCWFYQEAWCLLHYWGNVADSGKRYLGLIHDLWKQ